MIRIYDSRNKETESEKNKSIKKDDSTTDNQVDNQDKKNNKKKKIIKIILGTFLVVLISLIIAWLLFKHRPWEKEKEKKIGIPDITKKKYTINVNDYKKELTFPTKVNDMKRLSIKQVYNESMIIDGIEIQMKYFKNTIIEMYFISENIVDEENKIFTASISMARQCLSRENEDCELKDFVNLLNNSQKNLSNLKEISDLKDIPIPLCLVNISDNNIINSISCPESLPKNIINELLSYISYFRPIAKMSSRKKHEMGITNEKDTKNIRKQSKGLCDISSNSPSFCDIDTNITKDSEGNLLSFNETSAIEIITDINNTFSYKKTINLIDETSQITNLNIDKFNSTLNTLLIKLNPYMKYEEINTINKVSKKTNSKVIKDRLYSDRHLEDNNGTKYFIKEESLFNKEFYGIPVILALKIDSGINVESMKTFSNLKFGEKNHEISKIEQITNLNEIIAKLKSLSNKGNYLANLLYEKLITKIEDLTKELSIQISNLTNFIIYKDLREIFNSSLLFNDDLQILSIDIIEDSNILFDKLNKTLYKLKDDNSELKNNSLLLKNNINNCLRNDLMKNIFNGIDNLTNLLNSPENKFREIVAIHSDKTPNPYVNIIPEVNNAYKNYCQESIYINETIESLVKDFSDSINKSNDRINYYCNNLLNESLKIKDAEKEDYEKIINNLYNSNEHK